MRIAVDARIIYTSTGRYIERLLDHLQDIDTTNEYLVLLARDDFDCWQAKSDNFTKVLAPYRPFTLAEQFQFAWQLYFLKCDLVHFTQAHFPLLYLKRHVITIHDLTLVDYVNKRREGFIKDLYRHHIKPAAFRLAMWWAVHASERIITPTRYVKNEIIRRYRIQPGKVVVTIEAVDALAVKLVAPTFVDKDDAYLMYLGNAFPYKNIRFLLDAFHQLSDPKLKLVLCGKKEYFYTELADYVRRAGIQNVIFAGFTPDDQSAWLYSHAKLFVHPSLSEGFCLPLLEAMYYGAPVLASRASCIPEVSGPAADYFDPHNQADLVASLRRLMDNPQRRAELTKLGHEHVATFSWERMARQTLAVYLRS